MNKSKLSTIILYFSILLFTIAFNFSDHGTGGWTQQFFPNLNGRVISDICFTDSLNGYATGTVSFDPNYFLKTTDSGNNWFIVDSVVSRLTQIQFLNDSIGFAAGARIYKTTNKGINWNQLPGILGREISIINEDTLFVANDDVFDGGVFRSTDGGNTWVRLYFQFMQNPKKIYMYNSRIGFMTNDTYLKKTTDGGSNWVSNSGGAYLDIYFIDSLTGWKSYGNFKKTTDGGITWQTYSLPSGGIISISSSHHFKVLNIDTLWSVGSSALYGATYRGLLNISTDGGITWGYQQPNTSIRIGGYDYVNFVNKNNGWAYYPLSGIHTNIGGDTTIYTGIVKQTAVIPEDFSLHQNYPNPFNPRTIIPFSLKKSAFVKLTAFDITGKEVQNLVNGRYEAGEYEVDFMGKFMPSGVYFYRIEIPDNNSGIYYTETKSMMLIK